MASRERIQKESGFTLVEVMTVLGIVAILSALAYPNFMKSRQKSVARSITYNFYNALQSAKAEAMKKGLSVGVEVNPANREVVSFINNGTDLAFDEAEDIALARFLYQAAYGFSYLSNATTWTTASQELRVFFNSKGEAAVDLGNGKNSICDLGGGEALFRVRSDNGTSAGQPFWYEMVVTCMGTARIK